MDGTRAPHDFEDVSLGEIYRILLEVRTQTTLTNGRLRAAESTLAVHSWALGLLGGGGLVWLGVWLAKVL